MPFEHPILVPEAIAIAEPHELIAHDCDMRLPQACAGNMILRQHSNPSVDVVHGLVQLLQCCSERRVRCDLGEIAQTFPIPMLQIPLQPSEIKGLAMLSALGDQVYGKLEKK